MAHEPTISDRKQIGQTPIPQLRAKLDLLKNKCELGADGAVHRPLASDSAIAQSLIHSQTKAAFDVVELCRLIQRDRLPYARLPALLRLFGLKQVPAFIDPNEQAHRFWVDLVAEPLDAFAARVRLAGGESYDRPPAERWDAFYGRRAVEAEQHSADHLAIELVSSRSRMRGLPPRGFDPVKANAAACPMFRTEDHVRVVVRPAGALGLGARPLHVFMFHDIRVRKDRYFVPLVPYPPDCGAEMPEGIVAPAGTMLVPSGGPSDANYLRLPPGWGQERTLVALIARQPLDDEVLEDSKFGFKIDPERLDLLAARLGDPNRWPTGSFRFWQLRYRVRDTAIA